MMVCVALKSKQKQFNGQRYTTNTNFWDFLRNSIWWINNFGENLSRFCKLLNTCFSHSRNLAGTKFCGLGLNPQKSQNLVPAIFSPLRVDKPTFNFCTKGLGFFSFSNQLVSRWHTTLLQRPSNVHNVHITLDERWNSVVQYIK